MNQSRLRRSSLGGARFWRLAARIWAAWAGDGRYAPGSCPAVASQDNATITGNVIDSSGAVVPNAHTDPQRIPATGQVRETVSNSTGAYRFANVGVGTYTLTATATGFPEVHQDRHRGERCPDLEADAALTVGSQTQTVTVAADALQVQTETSEVSTLISGEQVSQLATNGRNITSLAALGLGVSNNLPPFGGVNALTSANGISFNGTAHHPQHLHDRRRRAE